MHSSNRKLVITTEITVDVGPDESYDEARDAFYSLMYKGLCGQEEREVSWVWTGSEEVER